MAKFCASLDEAFGRPLNAEELEAIQVFKELLAEGERQWAVEILAAGIYGAYQGKALVGVAVDELTSAP